jgi:hypothetical protein
LCGIGWETQEAGKLARKFLRFLQLALPEYDGLPPHFLHDQLMTAVATHIVLELVIPEPAV